MLTAKEYFKLCNKELLYSHYTTLPLSMQYDKHKKKFFNWYNEIINTDVKPKDTGMLILSTTILKDSYNRQNSIDSCLIKLDDLKKYTKYNQTEIPFDLTTEIIWQKIKEINTPKEYKDCFKDWNRILNTCIPDIIIKKYKIEKIMASIAYEMTRYGATEDEINQNRKKIHQDITKIINLAKTDIKAVNPSEINPEDEYKTAKSQYITKIKKAELLNKVFDEIFINI